MKEIATMHSDKEDKKMITNLEKQGWLIRDTHKVRKQGKPRSRNDIVNVLPKS